MSIFTIGHGARTTTALIELLTAADVGTVVDVRRFPGSRRHPHLAREALERDLPRVGIAYEWWGETLGGRRRAGAESRHSAIRNSSFRAYADHMDGREFRDALGRLEERASAGEVLALMCAETLWWRCHRRMIADALVLDGHEVVHVVGPEQLQHHEPMPEMRADEQGRPVYDAGAAALFGG